MPVKCFSPMLFPLFVLGNFCLGLHSRTKANRGQLYLYQLHLELIDRSLQYLMAF